MDTHRRADALVAARLRLAAAREPLPGTPTGHTAAALAESLSAGSPHQARFQSEIAAAVHGTALALQAARPHPSDLWAAAARAHPDPSVWFEQAPVIGHPTHPLARSRGTMTDEEIRAFAPEHRPRLDLPLHPFPTARTSADWPARTPQAPLIPLHPWQAARHHLTEPAAAWTDAAPLMSLRTLSTGPSHIKCAIDLQLTSAIRHVSAAACANGPALTRALTGPARAAGITLLPEQSAIPHDHHGNARPDLAAIIRPAPHTLGHHRAVPLAALAEPCPATGRPIAAAIAGDRLDQWWTALTALTAAPLRLFQATGAALEAHGQNLLIAFDGDRPTALLYRDLGGVRVPTAGFPPLQGDLQTDDEDERVRKLLAALYPTTMTSLVDAIAAWTHTDPLRWWKTVADTARAAAGTGALAHALLEQPWPLKATCAMRLADQPTRDLWTSVDNPLAAT
ncbi:IucA/IucC family siderophore biosynthesis protein [Glycomyces halotolerans]